MRKVPFIIVLTVEIVIDLIAMAMLMSDLQAWSYLIGAAILAVAMTPFLLALKKVQDETKKAKIRRNLVLLLTVPALITLTLMIVVIVGMMMYFG